MIVFFLFFFFLFHFQPTSSQCNYSRRSSQRPKTPGNSCSLYLGFCTGSSRRSNLNRRRTLFIIFSQLDVLGSRAFLNRFACEFFNVLHTLFISSSSNSFMSAEFSTPILSRIWNVSSVKGMLHWKTTLSKVA